MWIMLSDAFISIVNKDCKPGELLVRARRPGDIERVFMHREIKVTRSTDSDYLYRAVVKVEDIELAMGREIDSVDYSNFKDSVEDHGLHMAYLRVWSAMAALQDPPPYSAPFTGKKSSITP
jgi:hypothetical protein